MLDEIEISCEAWCWMSTDIEPYYLRHEKDDDKYFFTSNRPRDKVYVPVEEARQIFDEIQKLDYIKILQEASNVWGYDGGRDIIKLHMGSHDLTIALWEFDIHTFSQYEESKKLLSIKKQIESLAEKVGFDTRKIRELTEKDTKDGYDKTIDLSQL